MVSPFSPDWRNEIIRELANKISDLGAAIHAATSKTTPVDADEFPLADSAASFALKSLTWANLKATLKTYFDTMYVALTGAQTVAGVKTFSSIPVLSGGGISFPATQVPSAGANVLDDYEEGSWTPTLTFGGASVGITYTTRQGRYTKIGNQVTLWCYIKLSSKGSSTGSAIITGVPFTALSNMSFYAGTVGFYSGTTSVINAGTAIPAATSVINLYNLPGGVWSDTNVGNTTDIILTIAYEA